MELERFFRIRIISPDGNTVYNIPDDEPVMGIVSGSMHLNELICDREFEIGKLLANKFEVSVYGLQEDVSGYWIIVSNTYYVDHGAVVRPEYWFKGIVDSSKTDNKNLDRKIVAYDYSYSVRDIVIDDWWTDFWNGSARTKTLQQIRESVCNYVGLTPDSSQVSLPNDTASFGSGAYPLPTITNVTFADFIRMICELQGSCPNVSRKGSIEFIPMTDLTHQGSTDISNEWAKNDTVFEDYETAQIEGIAVYDSNSTVIQVIPTQVLLYGGNVYPIVNNLFILAITTPRDVMTLLTPVLHYLRNVLYSPAEIVFIVSNYSHKLGNLLSITDSRCTSTRCTMTYHLVLNQTFSGPQLVDQTVESVAFGSHLRTYAQPINDPIILT